MRRKTVTSISRCRTLHSCHKFDTCTLFPDSPRRNIIFMYVKYVLVSTRTWDQKAENRAIPSHPFLYHLIHKTLNKKTPPPQNKHPPSKTPRKKCKMLMSFLHGGNRKSQKKKPYPKVSRADDFSKVSYHHHSSKHANPTAAAMASALARATEPALASGPQHARL